MTLLWWQSYFAAFPIAAKTRPLPAEAGLQDDVQCVSEESSVPIERSKPLFIYLNRIPANDRVACMRYTPFQLVSLPEGICPQ